ncbi:hypothetical protein Aduo_009214 [Ancylostoma duodenale]
MNRAAGWRSPVAPGPPPPRPRTPWAVMADEDASRDDDERCDPWRLYSAPKNAAICRFNPRGVMPTDARLVLTTLAMTWLELEK